MCTECSTDIKKGVIPRKGRKNNGWLKRPPKWLAEVTATEWDLARQAMPLRKCYNVGQYGKGHKHYKGHYAAISQDIQSLASKFPRLPEEVDIFVVARPGQNIDLKHLYVNRKRMERLLKYLIRTNIRYKNFIVDPERLLKLPLNGVPQTFRKLEVKEYDNFCTKAEEAENEGPLERDFGGEIPEEDKVQSESFIPNVCDKRTESTKIKLSFEKDGENFHWVPQLDLESEFNNAYLYSAIYPDLFIENQGDPTSPKFLRDVTWAQKIKHLIRFAWKNDDGTWTLPCEEHVHFAYHALNQKMRHQILGSSKIFLNNASNWNGKTSDELQEILKKGGKQATNLMKSMNYCTKNVSGSAGYWWKLQKELVAAIKEKGAPTFFLTYSAADTHWPKFFELLTGRKDCDPVEKYKLLHKHPMLSGDFFKKRWKKYWSQLQKALQIKDFWWRYEFQQRGEKMILELQGSLELL